MAKAAPVLLKARVAASATRLSRRRGHMRGLHDSRADYDRVRCPPIQPCGQPGSVAVSYAAAPEPVFARSKARGVKFCDSKCETRNAASRKKQARSVGSRAKWRHAALRSLARGLLLPASSALPGSTWGCNAAGDETATVPSVTACLSHDWPGAPSQHWAIASRPGHAPGHGSRSPPA